MSDPLTPREREVLTKLDASLRKSHARQTGRPLASLDPQRSRPVEEREDISVLVQQVLEKADARRATRELMFR